MTIQRIQVRLDERSYQIEIGAGILASGYAADAISMLAPGRRIALVTHPGLRAAYAEPLLRGLQARGFTVATILQSPGERHKTLTATARLYREFLEAGLDRTSLIVAVGGGVLGDTVGFAAATYLRGVRFVQVPTTLLAQVDASVGGKTGVDLPEGKNLVGAFHQPAGVIIDTDSLATLPMRELRAGLAEVIKYGIIYDAPFFASIGVSLPRLLRRDPSTLIEVIARSCAIKAEVVSQDETEQGLRAILNFGHTIGHALEAVTNYRRYKHGEAVAIGMVAAALIGEEIGVTPEEATNAIVGALRAASLPVSFPGDVDAVSILTAARRDKKTIDSQLRFVVVRALGDVFVSGDVPMQAVSRALARQQDLSDV